MPHIHLGPIFILSVLAAYLLFAIPAKIAALMLHDTRIGQALAFAF